MRASVVWPSGVPCEIPTAVQLAGRLISMPLGGPEAVLVEQGGHRGLGSEGIDRGST